jgi:nucleoside-diphosphate-sugar epimerase
MTEALGAVLDPERGSPLDSDCTGRESEANRGERTMKKVFITGATGFIGGHLVSRNLERGNRVRALVRPGNPLGPRLEQRSVDVVYGDVRDGAVIHQATEGVDVVFHCAAVVTDWGPWKLFEEVTIKGSENVCTAARECGVGRLVYVSTNDVFGPDETRVLDESCPFQSWKEPYPDAKIQAEKHAWEIHRQHGLPLTIVYPCWVYGEGDRTFVPLLADAIRKREMVFWRKNAVVWPTYIENLMDVMMLIGEDERAVGNGYLVHDGDSVTLQEFCAEMAKAMGLKRVKARIPYSAAYATAVVMESLWKAFRVSKRPLLTTYAVKNLGSRLRFSIDKANRELDWSPAVPYSQGFARTMEWLKTLDPETLKEK